MLATATPLEWLLAGFIATGLLVMLWLVYDAVRDQGWVEGRRAARPDLDWSSVEILATNRLVLMVVLAAVQGVYLVIAGVLLLTMPAGPPMPTTVPGLVVRWGLILTEILLVGLAIHLRWRRKVLVDNVARIGGD